MNHLTNARQLMVGLRAAEPYPFIEMTVPDAIVGTLDRGDSTAVRFQFKVASIVRQNRRIQFYTRIQEGAQVDEPDMLSFGVNMANDEVHDALSALYTATNGDNWRRNDGWDISRVPTSEELAQWYGVYLPSGFLLGLHLGDNNLSGTIPAGLARLSFLQELNLNSNSLDGYIPTELSHLTQLRRLNLGKNLLTGWIFSELGNLSELRQLRLNDNDLYYKIPRELGNLAQLRRLDLHNNSFDGPLPPELGNLTQLQRLDLHNNSFDGPLPPELGNLAQLQRLDLHNNPFDGPLPLELGNLAHLEELHLHHNKFNGQIPGELGNLARLEELNLSHNEFTGQMPSELGNLAQLEWLNLHWNSLSGPIPSELGNLARLKELNLNNNRLGGKIPSELGNLAQLKRLNLDRNRLTGPIPSELGNLAQLEQLYLKVNLALTGQIPREFGKLAQLKTLDLGWNRLSGPIPSELGNLAQLEQLHLGNNPLLTGQIPRELGNLAQLKTLDLGWNRLSGPIPSELGNLAQLKTLDLDRNRLSGPIPSELGNLAQLQRLDLSNNSLIGTLPRNLMQLTQLTYLYFYGQDVCAPNDDVFQAWLGRIPYAYGPTCPTFSFTDTVADQFYPLGQAIANLVLPEVTGGTPPYTYALAPTLPAGLNFDAHTRVISGTPTALTPATLYTYSAKDAAGQDTSLTFSIEVVAFISFAGVIADHTFQRAKAITPFVLLEATGGGPPSEYTLTPDLPAGLTFDNSTRTISGIPTVTAAATSYTFKATGTNGSSDSVRFSITVHGPVNAENESLPVAFALRGNYPNPFHQATHISFDLPWRANVRVNVTDVLGRRVLALPYQDMTAGWERSIRLDGAALSPGPYVYRVYVQSPAGDAVHAGRDCTFSSWELESCCGGGP